MRASAEILLNLGLCLALLRADLCEASHALRHLFFCSRRTLLLTVQLKPGHAKCNPMLCFGLDHLLWRSVSPSRG